MHRRVIGIVLYLIVIPVIVFAQDYEDFSADRPGVGTGTGIVGRNKVMWETGMAYDYEEGEKTYTFCNSLLRYGLTNNWEVRLELNGLHTWNGDYHVTGLDAIKIATKMRLYEGTGMMPSVALQAGLTLPVGTKAFFPSYIAPSLTLLADHNVANRINLSYNAGLEWDGETAVPTIFTALCVNYEISDRWGLFAENYDFFAKCSRPQWNMDLGVNWMLNDRVQLDLSGCFSLNNIRKSYGISAGVAWLIN